jgi:hypothetical protein
MYVPQFSIIWISEFYQRIRHKEKGTRTDNGPIGLRLIYAKSNWNDNAASPHWICTVKSIHCRMCFINICYMNAMERQGIKIMHILKNVFDLPILYRTTIIRALFVFE